MKINIPESDLRDWVYNKETALVKENSGKHDSHYETYVTKHDDKYWRYDVEFSYRNGIQVWGDTEAEEVREVEKVIKVWEPV